jgi:hypothetical protein
MAVTGGGGEGCGRGFGSCVRENSVWIGKCWRVAGLDPTDVLGPAITFPLCN